VHACTVINERVPRLASQFQAPRSKEHGDEMSEVRTEQTAGSRTLPRRSELTVINPPTVVETGSTERRR
jgi:hypothetical protein